MNSLPPELPTTDEPSEIHPYDRLSHDRVMDAIEAQGYLCDARVMALNSYENRVFQVGLEDRDPIIAKFYRPGRWSTDAILEEHAFLADLAASDIPVIAPLTINDSTLFNDDEFRIALFPRRGGHAPELSSDDDLELIGRWLARLHNCGAEHAFQHRPVVRGSADIREAAETVRSSPHFPSDYHDAYDALIRDILAHTDQIDIPSNLRLHGDMHTGNLLLRDEQLYLVDFDDCVQGPAMQDLWMLLSGSREEHRQQLMVIAEGYGMFRDFPAHELPLIETLRTRRMVRHAAWLCQRWRDPAFPVAFPWFASHRYWSEHLLALREQLAALQDEPLTLPMF